MLREERPYESLSQRMTRDSWVIIFADLLALLLTFFVLIFSMTSIETKNWEALSRSFATQLERSEPAASPATTAPRAVIVPQRPAIRLDYLSNVMRDALREKRLSSFVALGRRNDALVISMASGDIFEPDRRGLNRRGQAILFELTALLSQLDNAVIITGHVSRGETEQPDGPAAIEASLIRAAAIAQTMREQGYARPLEVVGRGVSGTSGFAPAAGAGGPEKWTNRIDILVMEKGHDG